jgi:hypothetical protein
MKTILFRAVLAVILLLAGFAAGVPVGQSMGFTTGSEWSFKQAEIVAREAGVFMPVNYREGAFRVIVKQPRHLYRKASRLAGRYEEEMAHVNSGTARLIDRVQLGNRPSLMQ